VLGREFVLIKSSLNLFIEWQPAKCSDGKPRGTASSRGSIFTVLVLVLRVTVLVLVSVLRPSALVLVLVLPLLSWSCTSRPRQFKTPVEKCQQQHRLTRNPAGKVLDSDQFVRTLTQMNSQLFIPSHNSTVCGHCSRGYGVLLLHW